MRTTLHYLNIPNQSEYQDWFFCHLYNKESEYQEVKRLKMIRLHVHKKPLDLKNKYTNVCKFKIKRYICRRNQEFKIRNYERN